MDEAAFLTHFHTYGQVMKEFSLFHDYSFDFQNNNYDNLYSVGFVSSSDCLSYMSLGTWLPLEEPFRLNRISFSGPSLHGARICWEEVGRFDEQMDNIGFRNLLEVGRASIEDCTRSFANDPTAFYLNMLRNNEWLTRLTAIQELDKLLRDPVDSDVFETIRSVANNTGLFVSLRKAAQTFLDSHTSK